VRNNNISVFPILIFAFLFYVPLFSCAQPLNGSKKLTRQDTLRGTITPERAWWNVLHYAINVTPDYNKKTIEGKVAIRFKVSGPAGKMQIDLQEPLQIDSIYLCKPNTRTKAWDNDVASMNDIKLSFKDEGNAHFADLTGLAVNTEQQIEIYYHGKPKEAIRPPWDGGWIWKKDEQGRPWMSVACQGLGASVWYPCKDHQSDEPDNGASLSIRVPDSLVAVGNGRLKEKKPNGDHTVTYTWAVVNPINNYNIIPYIGKYVTWHEDYTGEKGKLDCDYWVIDYNLEKAKKQFTQVSSMLKCLEYWFGPYPFYEDGYKLVESPHLGMEHQSAIAYGNRYRNGYAGKDLSQSGWGTKWDFIIVHESAHEWFANNITTNDIADMWVHEGFANYSETLYTECNYGKEAALEYVSGIRKLIANDIPIIGQYGVNQEGSGDMYYKGGNMIHNIRSVIGNDEKFRQILRGLNKDFYHKTVSTQEVEQYISKKAGIDFSKVFDQYLRTTQIPTLEYYYTADTKDKSKSNLFFRWTTCVPGFNMPLKINVSKSEQVSIMPTEAWKSVTIKLKDGTNIINPNFYINWKQTPR